MVAQCFVAWHSMFTDVADSHLSGSFEPWVNLAWTEMKGSGRARIQHIFRAWRLKSMLASWIQLRWPLKVELKVLRDILV